jgi:hypothetical protein
MSDTTDTEQPTELDEVNDLDLREARQYARRMRHRNAELESLAVENGELKRQLGLARAGVDPDSWLGQTIATAAAADGVDDPDRVVDLARALQAELNGGRGRQTEED